MVEYKPYFANRYLSFAITGFMVLGMLVVIPAAIAEGKTGPLLFALAWSVGMVFLCRWLLLGMISCLRIIDGTFYWETALRSGSFPLDDLISVRPYPPYGGSLVFEHRGGKPRIAALTREGYLLPFVQELRRMRPDLPVQLTAGDRVRQWWQRQDG